MQIRKDGGAYPSVRTNEWGTRPRWTDSTGMYRADSDAHGLAIEGRESDDGEGRDEISRTLGAEVLVSE